MVPTPERIVDSNRIELIKYIETAYTASLNLDFQFKLFLTPIQRNITAAMGIIVSTNNLFTRGASLLTFLKTE